MSTKARLASLANQISEKPKTVNPKKGITESAKTIVANPPHGEKADFVKVSITLPPDVYELVAVEATRRKKAKLPNAQISAIIREALVARLGG